MGLKTVVRSIVMPFRVMEAPRSKRVKPLDLTKGENLNATEIEELLKYPEIDTKLPPEVKPICLPGGHYRIEKFKKQK